MTDKTTIARPYARAAFAEAKIHGGLAAWSEALAASAVAVHDPQVVPLLDNPRVSRADLAKLLIGIAPGTLDESYGNFIRTLAENHRLPVLPEIATLFEELKNEAEGVADVTVSSAVELSAPQLKALEDALARRLKRQVRLHTELDPALIGGAVVRSGDLIIDGSLKGRLERIAHDLTA
jgi:F-type H+-transporting ATPase subunit delta